MKNLIQFIGVFGFIFVYTLSIASAGSRAGAGSKSGVGSKSGHTSGNMRGPSSATPAEAAVSDLAHTPISPNQGTDSCGLAWRVTKQKTLLGTFIRGTTNAFASPTWSMTMGTSGCEKHQITKRDEQAVTYVASNFYPLTAEMAAGRGEYLAGLAQVMGCNDSVVSDFSQETQRSFKTITNNADAFQTLQNVKQVIQKNPVLAENC